MKLLPLLCCALALAACSRKPPEPQAAAATTARTATPWDGMKQDEQRARDAQRALRAHDEAEQRRIEEATQ